MLLSPFFVSSCHKNELATLPPTFAQQQWPQDNKRTRNMDFPLSDDLRDPSQRLNTHWNHKIRSDGSINQLLSIGGQSDSFWVQEELFQATQRVVDGDYGVKEFENIVDGKDEDNEEEEVLTYSKENHQEVQEDTRQAIRLVVLLKACAKQKDLLKGSELHSDIVGQGLLEGSVYLGSSLISMYAKCGVLEKAQEVFDGLELHNAVCWNALLAGYAQHGHSEEVLKYYDMMQLEGFYPDAATFVSILKACGSLGVLEEGRYVHAQILRECLLERNTILASALIDMYAKCGVLGKAQEVFDELPGHSVILCNALITGYAQNGYGKKAIECFDQMQLLGYPPDGVTFSCILKACGIVGDLDKGQGLHALIVKEGLLEHHQEVCNALLDMYAKCDALDKAQQLFNELFDRNIVTWNTMISGYVEHGHNEETLHCFEWMKIEGFSPDAITFVCTLKACGSLEALEKGQQIHAQIVKEALIESHIGVSNAVVDMYAKCDELEKANRVFDELLAKDVVSWTALISGYAQHKHAEKSLECLEQMQLHGFYPNAITFACALKACSSIGALDKGQEIHAQVATDVLEGNILAVNALVDFYAKCGALEEAQDVFDEIPVWDTALWNVLVAGYAQHGLVEEAMDYAEQMRLGGFLLDAMTFGCILKACGSRGASWKGLGIHVDIIKQGSVENNLMVGTALLDMYAKCGMLAEAHNVFDKLPARDLISWSALMGGYAQLGQHNVVLDLFVRMTGEGTLPDTVTFTVLLNASSHSGLLREGQVYLEMISKGYGMSPTLEHHTCIVDLFCRAGHVHKAVAVMAEMWFPPNLMVWHTFLDSSLKFGNMELGRWAFERAVPLGKKNAVPYICMRGILTVVGREEDGGRAEAEGEERNMEEDEWVYPTYT